MKANGVYREVILKFPQSLTERTLGPGLDLPVYEV